MKNFFLLLLISIVITTLSTVFAASVTPLETHDFKNEIANKYIVIIDVRTASEFKQGHINEAINIDINNKNFKNQVINLVKGNSIAIYCYRGTKSKIAIKKLKKWRGDIFELNGGIDSWINEGLPVVK